jgi:hypothetical protein
VAKDEVVSAAKDECAARMRTRRCNAGKDDGVDEDAMACVGEDDSATRARKTARMRT